MKRLNQPIELIVQKPISILEYEESQEKLSKSFSKKGIETELISSNFSAISKKKLADKISKSKKANILLKTNAKDTEVNPWDIAHASLDSLGKSPVYIEPNLTNEFVVDRKIDVAAEDITSKSFGSGKSKDDHDPDWPPYRNIIWHLEDNFSQLKSARESVAGIDFNVRIGHLDTGYSKTHFVIPDSIRENPLQHNFMEGESPNDAHDPYTSGFLKQPGHGTGTLGILAGTKISLNTDSGVFDDYLGGAYFSEVVCCRISESVILFKTNAFADALNYLTQLSLGGTDVHVVSMSMGGAPSKIWADAVNAAYEAGITIVTAAGNNYNGLPTRHVVYPARFGRVIGACGVTFELKPYWTKKMDEMQGCYGPKRHMDYVLSAFTPNSPWASAESETIRFSGAGTSSATPQIAAAAAIYYRRYHEELNKLPKKWQRVEAIRNALYKSALKSVPNSFNGKFKEYFGNGIIKAADALDIPVPSPLNLKATSPDNVPWFPILDTIFKALPSKKENVRLDMFNTELAQLVYNNPELRVIIDDDQRDYDKISKKKWKNFRDAVINHTDTSITLKEYLKETANISK